MSLDPRDPLHRPRQTRIGKLWPVLKARENTKSKKSKTEPADIPDELPSGELDTPSAAPIE